MNKLMMLFSDGSDSISSMLLVPCISAFVLGVILTYIGIPLLRRLKFGQQVRGEGPKTHLKKIGTPTMGGVFFIVNMVILTLFFGLSKSGLMGNTLTTLVLTVAAVAAYGLLGFLDDFIKTVKKRSLGLKASQKLFGEIVIAIFVIVVSVTVLGRGTSLTLPFIGHVEAGWFYYLLAFILIAGVTNGVNFTDGLDGLAAGVSFFVYTGYALVCYDCVNNPPFDNVDYIALTMFCAIMAGICLSFIVFNHYPAKVFMGDTGSLFLGGGLAVVSILTGTELLLVIFGAVFVIEVLSVMIQVSVFKTTGKRVFPMTPIHHSFEQIGWKETKVVPVFWCASLVFTLIGLLIYFS